jgi:mannose-6-phosphate isomerase-like protein (cupin superfamily)
MMADEWLFSLDDVVARLPDDPGTMRFHYALRHGTMKIGLYAPLGVDAQEPHAQDELYVVVSGYGEFVKNGERRAFRAQDVIFVEAGATHRFEGFSADFSAWVIFWGAAGGER